MRITNQMIHNNLVSTLNRQDAELQKIEQNISTGVKIHLPSDDPIAATSQMLLRSRMNELHQYNRNVQESKERLNLIDGELASVTDILQRIRYLTVQAANGTNSDFELKEAISTEVEQHIRSLIDIGNIKDATGKNLFAGSVLVQETFKPIYSNFTEEQTDANSLVMRVEYQGDIKRLVREIERKEQIDVSVLGNHVFWGTNMQIDSNRDSSNYVANARQAFKIDGTVFTTDVQDTIDDIIEKINFANIDVSATKGVQNNMILVSKTPHQIWLEDVDGGTTLQDLGLIGGDYTKKRQ